MPDFEEVRSDGVSIVNNHIIGSTSTNPIYALVGVGVTNSSNILLRNNILFNQTVQVVYVINSSIQSGNNLAFRDDGKSLYDTNTYDYLNDLWGINPLFVELTDYHFRATSPAIDAGFNLETLVPDDLEGISRPQGIGYDIGAYEYHQ